MDNPFFERPILNSPYAYPSRHWELDETGQPTQKIIETRRRAEFITPIPKPRKRKGAAEQASLVFDEGKGLSTEEQAYDHTAIINGVRQQVDRWRRLPNPSQWQVTPETARLLQHWRHHKFSEIRPFFCQVEAVETAIWLTEVAPHAGNAGKRFLEHLANANNDANPELMRMALKLATGAGKTTVMAMLIAWQTINAVRHPQSKRFTRGFLIVAPGLTIRDRLRVLQPNDPDSYYQSRELVPGDMLPDLKRAKIVITNYHAFKRRERIDLSKGGRSLLQGRGEALDTVETEGQMLQRVMPELMGIPFTFTAKPVVAPPQPPRETIQVKTIRPERGELEIRFPRVAGYRVELPEERLTAEFTDDSILELTPDLVGPSITKNAGIIGEHVDLSLEHLQDMQRSTLLFHITQRLLYTKWRDPGEEPKLHLFGQLKRITKQWLDTCLVCKGGTYPAQLMYQELADMACERITAAITRAEIGNRPVKAVLDPYNPVGSTAHVNFNTSRTDRYETDSRRCQVNWVILDSDWEAEFCRVAEAHPRVLAYVKNHNLGFEVPYRYGSGMRTYIPDFIVLVDDGHGKEDPLHIVVEIKGYRREDAKEKKNTMEVYWVPGVNNHGNYGRWAFAEFVDVWEMQSDFEARVEAQFAKMIDDQLKQTTEQASVNREKRA